MSELLQSRLKELLDYDEETGHFRWRTTRGGRSVAGQIAGSPDQDGYLRIRVDYKRFLAHRLAFLYMRGSFPSCQVDHTNLDKSDNSWANLREATPSQNAANRRARGNKRIKGVYPEGRQWKAMIRKDGKAFYLGLFATEYEANIAYLNAAKLLHGQFARA